ncbi:hypothetical protein ACHQM5_022653 [Ranunculus cassubicifolius]
MTFNVLSWNVRGSRSERKAHAMRKKVRKFRPVIVTLQETKREEFSDNLSKFFWGNQEHKWAEAPSVGASGGIVVMWDVQQLVVEEVLQGAYSVSMLCRFKNCPIRWIFTSVYGPNAMGDKDDFWNELGAYHQSV